MTSKQNREVKDSVFVDLFYEDETAIANEISLYEAITGEKLPPDVEIEKCRVEQQIYMNFINDVEYQIDKKILVFEEHQSTINRNMPLRNLMLLGRSYEKIVPSRLRYAKGITKIPKPIFYTFYNGIENFPKEMTLKLSEAFIVNDIDEPSVELEVKVININPSAGHEVLDKCPILRDYGLFIDSIRMHQALGEENPYKTAIYECINKDILADYLQRKGSEVVNMLTAEYDYDLDIEVQREEAEMIGEKRGIIIGEKRGITIGEKRGITIGEQLGEQRAFTMLILNALKNASQEQVKALLGVSDDDIATALTYKS